MRMLFFRCSTATFARVGEKQPVFRHSGGDCAIWKALMHKKLLINDDGKNMLEMSRWEGRRYCVYDVGSDFLNHDSVVFV
jgi:hypothetical protein